MAVTHYNVAVVGATGAVGRTMLDILETRRFPIAELRALASSHSAGKKLLFAGSILDVRETTPEAFEGIDIALFSAGASVSKRFAPIAAEAGAVVIDNTSQFRRDEDIPLVVPEVNRADIFKHHGIIANPNCSTIQMLVALEPIRQEAGIERLVISTYQAVSGAGASAMEEARLQCQATIEGKSFSPKKFPHPIAFNVLPHIDVFQENGYTKEEMKMVWETRKIFGEPEMRVSATCVRVPVLTGHSEAVNVETREKISAAKVRELLENAPGVKVIDDPATLSYPMPADAAGTDPVYVGRIREDLSHEKALNLWIVSDNLRKGAALNAVQIAEEWIKGE